MWNYIESRNSNTENRSYLAVTKNLSRLPGYVCRRAHSTIPQGLQRSNKFAFVNLLCWKSSRCTQGHNWWSVVKKRGQKSRRRNILLKAFLVIVNQKKKELGRRGASITSTIPGESLARPPRTFWDSSGDEDVVLHRKGLHSSLFVSWHHIQPLLSYGVEVVVYCQNMVWNHAIRQQGRVHLFDQVAKIVLTNFQLWRPFRLSVTIERSCATTFTISLSISLV